MNIKLYAPLLLLFLSPFANAELINYNFTASVTGIINQSDREFTGVEISDTFSGTLTMDTSVPPIFTDGTTTAWTFAAVGLSITVGDYSVTLPPGLNSQNFFQVSQTNSDLVNTVNAGFDTASNTVDDWMATSFTIFANDYEGVAFDQPALPMSFDGADIFEGALIFSSTLDDGVNFHAVEYVFDYMDVVNVPLPAAFWLLVSSLALLKSRALCIR